MTFIKSKLIHTSPVTSQSPGYILTAMIISGEGFDTLELHTRFPGCKHPDPHRILQLTIDPKKLRELGWFLIDATD